MSSQIRNATTDKMKIYTQIFSNRIVAGLLNILFVSV